MGLKERLVRFRSFWIFPLLAIVLLQYTYKPEPQSSSGSFIARFALGIVLWTLLEYGLHRFLFHVHVRNRKLREVLNGSHYQHHAAPRDPNLILVHPSYGFGVSAVLYAVLLLAGATAFAAMTILSGIWAGFLYYELLHYRVHQSTSGSALIQHQRRAHFYHHFSHPDRNFGVTSPFWDIVFGTRLKDLHPAKTSESGY
jgi:sterol desaturase/sphingolipid hydroxylase (fatty acid hydroxylase superfamily)